MSWLQRTILILWVSPNSLIGLAAGFLAICSGGQCQVRRGCLEFAGGLVAVALRKMPTGSGASAMTLGHVILGQSNKCLELARDHEHVHVRQYERWGPIFIPAYLGCSAYKWLMGEDPYRDNPFEVEAYRLADLANSEPQCQNKNGETR